MTRNNQVTHALIFPFPAQGHINPMLQLAKRLLSSGIKSTLVTTRFIMTSAQAQTCPIPIETISDGYDAGGYTTASSVDVYLDSFRTVGSMSLSNLITKQINAGCPVNCVIYDAVMPWALDVAKKLGIRGAAFFTQSCTVNGVYYHVHRGQITVPFPAPAMERRVELQGLPNMEIRELPSFVSKPGSYGCVLDLLTNQFSNLEKVDWILFNTLAELENEVVDWMSSLWPIKTIGPTIPSLPAAAKKGAEEDINYGFNLWEPTCEACIHWLDSKSKGSVVYVSFGSIAALDSNQMEEILWGLRNRKDNFLWVVRESEKNKLPENFEEDIKEKGLVVTWCPQLEVLGHPSIGCFITHCGWNSVLEGLSLGVPMVAIPQWTDQPTNAMFVEDIWKVGVRAKFDEDKGMITREEIESCIKEVMEGRKGKDIKRNSTKWKGIIRRALMSGGSSDKNIAEFVDELVGK